MKKQFKVTGERNGFHLRAESDNNLTTLAVLGNNLVTENIAQITMKRWRQRLCGGRYKCRECHLSVNKHWMPLGLFTRSEWNLTSFEHRKTNKYHM